MGFFGLGVCFGVAHSARTGSLCQAFVRSSFQLIGHPAFLDPATILASDHQARTEHRQHTQIALLKTAREMSAQEQQQSGTGKSPLSASDARIRLCDAWPIASSSPAGPYSGVDCLTILLRHIYSLQPEPSEMFKEMKTVISSDEWARRTWSPIDPAFSADEENTLAVREKFVQSLGVKAPSGQRHPVLSELPFFTLAENSPRLDLHLWSRYRCNLFQVFTQSTPEAEWTELNDNKELARLTARRSLIEWSGGKAAGFDDKFQAHICNHFGISTQAHPSRRIKYAPNLPKIVRVHYKPGDEDRALAKQRATLTNILRACVGLEPESDMTLEHKLF